MGVKPNGLGAIEFGAMSLFSCTENSLFGVLLRDSKGLKATLKSHLPVASA